MDETEHKQEMNKRNEPDSFTMTSGSAAKGTAKALKVYFNLEDVDKAQIKLENFFKVKEWLNKQGYQFE